jgi:hypothetical protein
MEAMAEVLATRTTSPFPPVAVTQSLLALEGRLPALPLALQTLVGKVISFPLALFKQTEALAVLEPTQGQHLTTVDLLEMAAEMVALAGLVVRVLVVVVLAAITELAETPVMPFKTTHQMQEAEPQAVVFH